MKKTRVPKGEKYWYIDGTIMDYAEGLEQDRYCDETRFNCGNYFPDLKSAEAMARKLRAVLAGADVIEMPSEEEFYEFAPSTDKLGCFSLENRRQVQGFQDCWDWIKSKIVK